MASDDRAPGEILPPTDPNSGRHATFAIARVSRDILDQSTIGAIFTDREFAGGYNRVGGIDANIKLDQNWRLQGAAVTSSTLNVDGTHSAGPGYKLGLRHRDWLRQPRGRASAECECELLLPAGRKVFEFLGADAAAVQHLRPQWHGA